MKIKIEKVRFIEYLYPRNGFDNETVNQYRLNLDALPPIVVTKDDLVLVDGYHRLLAHRLERREEIEVEVIDIPKDKILWEATKRNAKHGRQLKTGEKQAFARKFWGTVANKELSEVLAVSIRTIQLWVDDLAQKEREERNEEVFKLFLRCFTQREIAEKFILDQSTVAKIIKNMKKRKLSEIHTPESLQVYNVWNFSGCDDRYGMQSPGRIPGQILENLLFYYTEPFDFVVDPMAGGGTTLDVCIKTMYRRCLAMDINPLREDIMKHNIRKGYPSKANNCDFIFLDPPYWRLKREKYGVGVSDLSYEEWLSFMGNLAKDSRRVLREGGHLALLLAPFFDELEEKTFLDLPFDTSKLFENLRFTKIQRISVPLPSQVKNFRDVDYAKNKRILLDLNRDLIVFRRE